MSPPIKNIGLFGGSFDPPHYGHLAVMRHVLDQHLFDEIWIVPVFHHPHEKKLTPYETRIDMLQLLVTEINDPHIKISTIEKDLHRSPVYTWDVVQALRQRHPDHSFTLILGSDARDDFPSWYRAGDLKKIVGFYYIQRKGYESSALPEVSSSNIRDALTTGKTPEGLTTPNIVKYMIKHKIYGSQ